MQIDLNCDLGEGGQFDAELMSMITTANVACGFHAGSPREGLVTVQLAARYGVCVGAHPSFPDRENFGRTEMDRSVLATLTDCVYQVGALVGLAKIFGMTVSHVKPHGALYNMACREDAMAFPVVLAAGTFGLPLLGLPASSLESVSRVQGVRFIAEGFADRRYRPDGSLVPRTDSGAFVESPKEAVTQAEWLIRERGVRSLCVHGDNPEAVGFVRALRQALKQRGFEIRAFA